MITIEAMLLFIIMFCVLFLTICMAVGILFLFRFYSSFKKLEQQVESLGKTVNSNITPVAEELRETAASVRELVKTGQKSVIDYTTFSMIRKVSPKLAGLKLGFDLSLKAYDTFMGTAKGSRNNPKNQLYRRMVARVFKEDCSPN